MFDVVKSLYEENIEENEIVEEESKQGHYVSDEV